MKSTHLTLIAALLTACGGGGGGGGGSPSTVATVPPSTIVPEWQIASNQLVNFGSYSSKDATSWPGNEFIYSEVLTAGDIDSDGFDDLVIGNFINLGVPIKPTLAFFNPNTRRYEPRANIQSILPTVIWPRQASIDDLNGDGRKDIFIGDHGEEGGTFTGGQNRLILNTVNGFIDGTNLLPQVKDYSHGLVTADFDGNGRNDLLVINSPVMRNLDASKTNDSYVLFNNGTNSLTKGTLNLINKSDINFDQSQSPGIIYHVATAANLNSDNNPDLILGGDDTLVILESEPNKSYKRVATFRAPSAFKTQFPGQIFPYSYVIAEDLDGDGEKEIVASIAHQETVTWQWLGSYYQVLKKSKDGSWQDATDTYFPSQTQIQTTKSWCYKLYFIDLNGDGKKDILCSTAEFLSKSDGVFWINENGKFVRKNPLVSSPVDLRQLFPVKLGTDTYIMGRGSMTEFIGWKL